MDHLPHDPMMLVSTINMLLRDEEFDTLESLCNCFDEDTEDLKDFLRQNDYIFSEEQNQFRPFGFDE